METAAATSFRSLLRKETSLFERDALENFRLYDRMKDKGLSDTECAELLQLHSDPETCFQKYYRGFVSMRQYVDGSVFRKFIIETQSIHQEVREVILKSGSYPSVLLLALFFSAVFFDRSILPMLNTSLMLWDVNDRSMLYFQIFLRVFWVGFIVLGVLLLVFLLRLKSRHYFYRVYIRSYQLKPDNLLVRYSSLYFAIYYEALLKNGVSTQNITESLIAQTTLPLISLLSMSLKKGLVKGEDSLKVIQGLEIDARLKRMFLIGEKSGELPEMLRSYIDLGKSLLIRRFSQVMKMLQYGIYLLVGIMIAVLYRLLMSPLGVISNL